MERHTDHYEKTIHQVVNELCRQDSSEMMYHRHNHEVPMPSIEELGTAVELLRSVIFPGYFGHEEVSLGAIRYYIGMNVDKIAQILSEQIKRGYCFECSEGNRLNLDAGQCQICEKRAADVTTKFIESLPKIRHLLYTDVKAAYEGDPAAKSYGECIFCYPSILVMTNHRIAHELLKLGVPLIPRIISELAHSRTGVDIHPGAEIDESFFIDHCTGTVIGETCIIGKHVRLYQGVTLGAKSFPMDDQGNPIKGIPRHPIVEDGVTIYSGAAILGRITIGANSTIGGNVWVTDNVAPGSRILQGKPR